MTPHDKVLIAGHRGLVGSALMRKLRGAGYADIITTDIDLRDQQETDEFFYLYRPDYVFLAAARVGGIGANSTWPAEFIYDNLMIAANVIHAAHKHGTKKLLFLGSSCIYPRDATQPITEDALLSGPLEETNRAYAVAKIAGMELAASYRKQYGFNAISLMPTNLYGPGDNFDWESSHVLPALISKFHDAKVNRQSAVSLWGTGAPRREFLHVDDLADAAVFAMQNYESDAPMNVGYGSDLTIKELAEKVAGTVGYQGAITFDASRPDGTPRKLLDSSRINAMGWKPKIGLDEGIRSTYGWFLANAGNLRKAA